LRRTGTHEAARGTASATPLSDMAPDRLAARAVMSANLYAGWSFEQTPNERAKE
jgi:hypothetical protein